jgi:hypothetical protein
MNALAHPAYDSLLDRLHTCAPNLDNGNFNHLPMVIEALHALGLGHRAPAWMAEEESRLLPVMGPVEPVRTDNLAAALGQRTRFADWVIYFADEIEAQGWISVLDRWARRLAPGYITAAVHGPIRTAHAVRALRRADTLSRRTELAHALAAWAAMYRTLPGRRPAPGLRAGSSPLRDVLETLPLVEARLRPQSGSISAGLLQIAGLDGFAAHIAGADLSGDPALRAEALIEVFLDLFVETVGTPYSMVVFTHAVTGTSAAREMMAVTGERTGRALLAGAFGAGCALKAAFLPETLPEALPGPTAIPDDSVQHLARRAEATRDDHAVKLTEAALGAYLRTGNRTAIEASVRAIEAASA